MKRRDFLRQAGMALVAGSVAAPEIAEAAHNRPAPPNALGMLVDTTVCIGCRKCELACDRENRLTKHPDKWFEKTDVFKEKRVLTPTALTVVNRYPNPKNAKKPFFVKTACMNCNDPSCVSACIVGALRKQPDGSVTYDYGKCIGCRYCMVACPFQVPTYEFGEPFKPRMMKCDLCHQRMELSAPPACADACPVSALLFGRRTELLRAARERILRNPSQYLDYIYGMNEAGGTSVMFLAGVPFETFGLPQLGEASPPSLSEGLQHSVFKNWIPPVSLYLLLSAAMWIFRRRDEAAGSGEGGGRS